MLTGQANQVISSAPLSNNALTGSTNDYSIAMTPCFRYKKISQKTINAERAMGYVQLRNSGCEKYLAMKFCARSKCRVDETIKRDGPSTHRQLIPLFDNGCISERGWCASVNMHWDFGYKTREMLHRENQSQEKLDQVIARNELQVKGDFKRKMAVVADYLQSLNDMYNFTQLRGKKLQNAVRDQFTAQRDINNLPKKYAKMDKLKFFEVVEEVQKQKKIEEQEKKTSYLEKRRQLLQEQRSQGVLSGVLAQDLREEEVEEGDVREEDDYQEQSPPPASGQPEVGSTQQRDKLNLKRPFLKHFTKKYLSQESMFPPSISFEGKNMKIKQKMFKFDAGLAQRLQGSIKHARLSAIGDLVKEGSLVMNLTVNDKFDGNQEKNRGKMLQHLQKEKNVERSGAAQQQLIAEFNNNTYLTRNKDVTQRQKAHLREQELARLAQQVQERLSNDVLEDLHLMNSQHQDRDLRKKALSLIDTHALEVLRAKYEQRHQTAQKRIDTNNQNASAPVSPRTPFSSTGNAFTATLETSRYVQPAKISETATKVQQIKKKAQSVHLSAKVSSHQRGEDWRSHGMSSFSTYYSPAHSRSDLQ